MRGRKRIYLTEGERMEAMRLTQRRWRSRQISAGLQSVQLWVTPEEKTLLESTLEEIRNR
jgi:hypothetical protein